MRRIISIVASLALALALVPTAAFAPQQARAAIQAPRTVGAFTLTSSAQILESDYEYSNGVLTIKSGMPLTIKNTDPNKATSDRIYVEKDKDANITLDGVNISASDNNSALQIADNSTGNVNITLAAGSTNKLQGGYHGAGLAKSGNSNVGKLTIKGDGSLIANGGDRAPGIGGMYLRSTANIVVEGGTVEANGQYWAAGIGGANGGDASNITISGGNVKVSSGIGGAGIGGGSMNNGKGGNASGITISGGTVSVAVHFDNKNSGSAAIGNGSGWGAASNIKVTGGSLKITGDNGFKSFGTQPTDASGEAVYLATIANPKSEDVTIDGKSWSPQNHKALESGDTNLYAYLTEGDHAVKVGNVERTYRVASDGSSTIVPKAITVSGITAKDKTYDGTASAQFDTSGATLSGVSEGDDVGVSVTGMFESADAGTGKTVNATVALTGDDAQYYTLSDSQLTLKASIAKADPGLSVEDVGNKTYGDPAFQLNASSESDRALEYESVGTALTVSDTGLVTIVGAGESRIKVTVAETANYKSGSKIITVNVAKATPSYDVPTGLTATYGDTLEDVALPSGWSWQDAATTSVGSAGKRTFKATYTPSDTKNYETVTDVDVDVTIAKATPTVSAWPSVAGIYVADTLLDLDLSGGAASAAGTFSISGDTKSWDTAGTHSVELTFKPSDTDNYEPVQGSASVVVSKRTVASVTTNIPAITDETVGTGLGDLGLPDKVDIETVDGKAFKNVLVTWGGYDFTSLAQQTLRGTLDLSAIDNEVEQPAVPVTATASVRLQQKTAATPAFHDKSAVYTGSPIAHELVAPEGVSSVSYSYEGTDGTDYAASSIAPKDAGTYKVTATFTMEHGYTQLAPVTAKLTIDKANPSISAWPTIADIYVGDSVGDVNLVGGTSATLGSFSVTGTPTSWDTAGEKSVEVTFTPTDTRNYNAETRRVAVQVNLRTAATPDFPNAAAFYTGDPIAHELESLPTGVASATYTYAGKDGTQYGPSTTAPKDAGDYTVTATFAMEAGYAQLDPVSSTLTIGKADPGLSVEAVADKTYGDSVFQIDATSVSGGTLSYKSLDEGILTVSGAGLVTIVGAGTGQIEVTVAGTQNYDSATETLTVNVDKTASRLDISGAAVQKTFGDADFSVKPGTDTPGALTYVSSQTDVATVDTEGRVHIVGAGETEITISMAETGTHHATSEKITLTVAKADPAYTAPIIKSDLVYNGLAQDLFDVGTATGGQMQYSFDGILWTTYPLSGEDVGTYTVHYRVVGDKDHNDVADSTLEATIAPATLTDVSVSQKGGLTYDGTAQTANVTASATSVGGQPVTFTYSATEDGTYSSEVPAFTSAGTHTVYYKASAPNHKTAAGSFKATIACRDIADAVIELSGNPTYTGKEQSVSVESVTLEGVTGAVTYSVKSGTSGTAAGTYTLVIEGTGNFTGTASAKWSIWEASSSVSARDVKATYGDTGVKISASGTGDLRFRVTKGADVVSVDAKTGALTILKAGTATVSVSSRGDANHAGASTSVSVSIARKDIAGAVIKLGENPAYTGGEQSVRVESVTIDGLAATYRIVSGTSGTAAGTYTLVVEGTGNFTGTASAVWSIGTAALADVSVAQDSTLVYNGAAQTPQVKASATSVDGQTVTFTYSATEDGNYSNEVPSFTDAGTYTVYYKASVANHETATGSFEVTIARRDIAGAEVELTSSELSYNGEKQTVGVASVALEGVASEVTYEVKSGASATKADDYTLVVEGTGNFTGTVSAVWSIEAVDGPLASAAYANGVVMVKWSPVKGASGYDIYLAKCGSKGKPAQKKNLAKTVKSGLTAGASLKKFRNGKKIGKSPETKLRVRVRAYRLVGGKKVYLSSASPTIHLVNKANKKFTNAKALKLSRKKLSLAIGASKKVKAKVVKVSSAKKLLPNSHVRRVRWFTSDSSVATVGKNGKVTAWAKGTCTVYAMAANGVSAAVTVTVS